MKAKRVVLDTNVLISSALSPKGKPAACHDWVVFNAKLLSSPQLLQELETRLKRPKFDRYISESLRLAFVQRLAQVAELVVSTTTVAVCRDPDDDRVLEVAVSGAADCIVTGDRDLLVLDPFQGIPILTPAAFLTTIVSSI